MLWNLKAFHWGLWYLGTAKDKGVKVVKMERGCRLWDYGYAHGKLWNMW